EAFFSGARRAMARSGSTARAKVAIIRHIHCCSSRIADDAHRTAARARGLFRFRGNGSDARRPSILHHAPLLRRQAARSPAVVVSPDERAGRASRRHRHQRSARAGDTALPQAYRTVAGEYGPAALRARRGADSACRAARAAGRRGTGRRAGAGRRHRVRAAASRIRVDECAALAGGESRERLKRRPGGTPMWDQVYVPAANSLPLSAALAALPIVTLLISLGLLRLSAWKSGLLGLLTAALVAAFVHGMPIRLVLATTAYGAAFGLFPIAWIVFWAVALYRLTVETGQFDLIKDSVGRLTPDRRLQALLIAFAFGAFIEGAAGFGTPVAVAAAMLTGLGFSPFYAAGICLVANTAPVAFGAIGTPLVTLAGVTNLPLPVLSAEVGRICAPVSLFIPTYLMLVMGGISGLRAVWPAALVCGVCFALTQFLVSNFIGPYLTDILASLATMLGLVLLLRIWHPADAAPVAAAGSAPSVPAGTVL